MRDGQTTPIVRVSGFRHCRCLKPLELFWEILLPIKTHGQKFDARFTEKFGEGRPIPRLRTSDPNNALTLSSLETSPTFLGREDAKASRLLTLTLGSGEHC